MSKPYVAAVNYGVTPPERLETMHLLDGQP